MGIHTKYKLCAKRNVIEMQRHRCRGKFPMNAPAITNIAMTQRRRFGANIPMNIFGNINTLMGQLGTSCSFDSPG